MIESKIKFKNQDKIDFITFLNNEQRLSIALIEFLVKSYNKLMSENMLDNFDEISLIVNKLDIEDILIRAEELDMTKKNIKLSFSLKKDMFLYIKNNIKYIIEHHNEQQIIISLVKFKEILRTEISGISLEDPIFLSESIRFNLTNILNRPLLNDFNTSKTEKIFLKILDERTSFRITDMSSLKKDELSKLKIILNNEELDYLEEFIKNLINLVRPNIYAIGEVYDALNSKTDGILSIVDKKLDAFEQINLISSYLNNTMQTLERFYDRTKIDTLNNYMQKINYIFIVYFKHSCKYQLEWDELKHIYEEDKIRLINNIKVIINRLESKQKSISFKAQIEKFFESFQINEDYDSIERRKEKQDSFDDYFKMNQKGFIKSFVSKPIRSYLNESLANLYSFYVFDSPAISAEEILEKKQKREINDKLEREKIEITQQQSIELEKVNLTASNMLAKAIGSYETEKDLIFKMEEKFEDVEFISQLKDLYKDLYKDLTNDRILYVTREILFKRSVR